MNKIKPLGKRVLIRRSKAAKTKGGIYLPESAQEKPKEGEILAVGPGKRNENGALEEVAVKVGDRVLFSAYAGTEVRDHDREDEEYLIMSEDEILGIMS